MLRMNVNAMTTASRRTSPRRGRLTGAAATRMRTAPQARTRPTSPPAIARRMLSERKTRAIAPPPAPIARRTAISRCLASARTRKRFATFAQATSITTPTAASRTQSALPASPIVASFRVLTVDITPIPGPVAPTRGSSGKTLRMSPIRLLISARTSATVTPSPKRAIPSWVHIPRPVVRVILSGNQISTRRSGNANPDGITPTIAVGTSSTVMICPMTPGSPP